MSTIGFIGLGVMGSPMAVHLVRAGHDVTGYDVVPKGVDALVAAGGSAASGVPGAVAGAEVVDAMLPQDEHVEADMNYQVGLRYDEHGTDNVKIMEAYGRAGRRVLEPGGIRQALEWALPVRRRARRDGPALKGAA